MLALAAYDLLANTRFNCRDQTDDIYILIIRCDQTHEIDSHISLSSSIRYTRDVYIYAAASWIYIYIYAYIHMCDLELPNDM